MLVLPVLLAMGGMQPNPSVSVGGGGRHQTAGCAVLDSEYRAAGQPEYRLAFVKLASSEGVISDVGLHLTAPDPRNDIWYYFDHGSDPRVSLISTFNPTLKGWKANPDGGPRPFGSAQFLGMKEDDSLMVISPNSRSAGLKYIIIPELARIYRGAVPEYRPSAFVLIKCAR